MKRNIPDNGDLKKTEKVPNVAPHLAVLALATLTMLAPCVWLTVPFLPALALTLGLIDVWPGRMMPERPTIQQEGAATPART